MQAPHPDQVKTIISVIPQGAEKTGLVLATDELIGHCLSQVRDTGLVEGYVVTISRPDGNRGEAHIRIHDDFYIVASIEAQSSVGFEEWNK